MAVELIIPEAGESIQEVQVGEWRKEEGTYVDRDEVVVEIATDKANMEVPAPVAGVLVNILKAAGEDGEPGDVIGLIEPGAKPQAQPDAGEPAEGPPEPEPDAPAVAPEAPATPEPDEPRVTPAARRVLGEAGVSPSGLLGTGAGGRISKEDAIRAVESSEPKPAPVPAPPPAASEEPVRREVHPAAGREVEVVSMTPLRRAIAKNLVQAQQRAALLTTFNEADMSAVIALRRRHREGFLARHGIKLGFMSFFVRAVVGALQDVPAVNAQIRDEKIVYHRYQDIGIAVGGGRGLVVPVLRDADTMSFAEIERAINDFAARARDNKIELSELQGGTFTISNGGIYGSMLSTPIVNQPQSGILGMHAIQDRPVAVDGQVVVRPMMYLALTYDHRIVDGREAVTFLRRVKDLIECPERIWLDI